MIQASRGPHQLGSNCLVGWASMVVGYRSCGCFELGDLTQLLGDAGELVL